MVWGVLPELKQTRTWPVRADTETWVISPMRDNLNSSSLFKGSER